MGYFRSGSDILPEYSVACFTLKRAHNLNTSNRAYTARPLAMVVGTTYVAGSPERVKVVLDDTLSHSFITNVRRRFQPTFIFFAGM